MLGTKVELKKNNRNCMYRLEERWRDRRVLMERMMTRGQHWMYSSQEDGHPTAIHQVKQVKDVAMCDLKGDLVCQAE